MGFLYAGGLRESLHESRAQATNPPVAISARLEESQSEMMNYSLLPIKSPKLTSSNVNIFILDERLM